MVITSIGKTNLINYLSIMIDNSFLHNCNLNKNPDRLIPTGVYFFYPKIAFLQSSTVPLIPLLVVITCLEESGVPVIT
jgi:hypothetical protein